MCGWVALADVFGVCRWVALADVFEDTGCVWMGGIS